MKLFMLLQVRVPVNDMPNVQLHSYFDEIVDMIDDNIKRNNNCLIHCVAGVSRSATLCIAYLMKHHK